MKKNFIISIILIIFFSIIGYSVYAKDQNNDTIILNGNLSSISFEELISESDIIAKVKVLELVETFEVPGDHITKFKGKVQKYYKNATEYQDEISFYFLGSPTRQYIQNPILEVNSTYVLFLRDEKVPTEDTLFSEEKILLLVNEGFGRFNIVNDEIAPQLELKNDRIFKETKKLKLTKFEQLLKEYIDKDKK